MRQGGGKRHLMIGTEGLLLFSLLVPWGVFHCKGTRGCATRKGIFQTSCLAKGILFGNFLVEFSQGKGMLFGNFGQRNVKIW